MPLVNPPHRHDKVLICQQSLTASKMGANLAVTMSIPEVVGVLVQRYGSVGAASRKADIPLATLYRLYTGEHKQPTLDTLRKIAAALDMPLHELVRQLEDGEDARERSSLRE